MLRIDVIIRYKLKRRKKGSKKMNKEQTTALMAKIDNLVVQLRRNGRIKQIKEDGQNYYVKI